MIISHRKKFVIFAPWKTASSTMRMRLGAYCENPYSLFYAFNPHLQRVVHQHLTCADFQAFPESRLGYFRASFVRNPYDRVYSGFQQLQRAIQSQPKDAFPQPWIRDMVMREIIDNFAQFCLAGYDFDAWVAMLGEHQVYDIGRNVSFPVHPAHYWTHLNGVQAVDFIGRVENFEVDFGRLCTRLGIENASRANANVDVEPNSLPEGRYKYTSRMSPASIARINHLFSADFDLFGYPRAG